MKISLSTSSAAAAAVVIRSARLARYSSLCAGGRSSPSPTNKNNRNHTQCRNLSSSTRMSAKYAPAKRVAGQKQDVWSIVNEAAAASPVQPIVNMGQGFL
jgi:hypothetical protein